MLVVFFCFFFLIFFFQAEDGIRDWSVTGVQTCALPISWGSSGQDKLVSQSVYPSLVLTSLGMSSRDLPTADRKSVVQGKSVDLGGRRIIKKKKEVNNGTADTIESVNMTNKHTR